MKLPRQGAAGVTRDERRRAVLLRQGYGGWQTESGDSRERHRERTALVARNEEGFLRFAHNPDGLQTRFGRNDSERQKGRRASGSTGRR